MSQHRYCIYPRNVHSIIYMLYEDSRYIQSIFRETDFWLRMSRLICDAGLFMFQSRSQWQFIWRTHKKAKYLVKYRWFLGISGWRVTCRGVNIYWMQSLRLETEAECCADTRQCVLGAEQTTVRARREERDSVGVRSVRSSHVSRDPSRVITSSEPSGDLSQLWSVTQTLSSCHQSLSLDVTRGIRQ